MDIVITEFQNRMKPIGKVKHTTWEDLIERLKNPVITKETLDEYRSMTNEDRTEVKDVGGYVAGEFESGRRSKDKLKSRYILTIDADDATGRLCVLCSYDPHIHSGKAKAQMVVSVIPSSNLRRVPYPGWIHASLSRRGYR